MDKEISQKLEFLRYSHTAKTLHNHRAWFIYTAAIELEQPFSLHELQDAICKKVAVRPQIKRLLEETRKFYEEYDISIINRVEPSVDSFTVSQDIDLDRISYREIIRPPQEGPGRPRKKYIQDDKKLKSKY